MDKYKLINRSIGEGSYGSVSRAMNKQTGEVVAIKKMKAEYNNSVEECSNLIEVKSLQTMKHPNIVKLKEHITENGKLYLVFENMECNLYEFMRRMVSSPPDEGKVRNWCLQVFQALAYMNQRGYYHRDLKLENFLVSSSKYGGLDVKLADFGCAREVSSQAPYTHCISTLWYRAPEVMLRFPVYDSAIDMWAMGAIMAELFNFRPLFPGTTEIDEIYKICSVLGSPNQESWAEGLEHADSIKFRFPHCSGVGNLSALIPTASEDAISLITSLCSWDPRKRPTAAEALRHPFFRTCFYIPPSLRSIQGNNQASLNSGVQTNKLEQDHHQQVENNNCKEVKDCVRQPRYRPPQARNVAPATVHNATVTQKMAQLNIISSGKLVMPKRQQEAAAPPMKAGGDWQMHHRQGPSVRIPKLNVGVY